MNGSPATKLLRLLAPAPVPEEFHLETRSLTVSRLRIVLVLAIALTPAFVPLDYVRMPKHFTAVVTLRLIAVALLVPMYVLTGREWAKRNAFLLSAAAVFVIGGYLAATVRLTEGAHDPVYLHQSMALIFVIMGVGLLFPLDARRIALLAGIPFVTQIVMTLDFDPVANVPILTLSAMALIITTVGGHSAFTTRLGDYLGRSARETLLRTRSDFVAMLTHDLRDPLSAVSGCVSILREGVDSPAETDEMLRRIESSNQRALLLTNNFLDVSRIEEGRIFFRPAPTDVLAALRAAMTSYRGEAEAKRVDLVLEAAPEVPRIDGDRRLLERIFANLLSNAVKFTPAGGSVRASVRRDGSGNVEVTVEDSGEGIPEEALPRIFQRYAAGTTRADSTGLGLYIVKTFTEAHGGRVCAANRADRSGARMRLVLPVERTLAPVTEPSPAPADRR